MKNHWLAKQLTTFATIAFLVLGMLAAAGTAANANELISVKQASLDDHAIGDDGNGNICGSIASGQLNITQVDNSTAPASIQVTWDNGTPQTVNLTKVPGGSGVAQYVATAPTPTSRITAATASVYDGWGAANGQFILSHYNCGTVTPTCTTSTLNVSWAPPGLTDLTKSLLSGGSTSTWVVEFYYGSGPTLFTVDGSYNATTFVTTGSQTISPAIASTTWGFQIVQRSDLSPIHDFGNQGTVTFDPYPACSGSGTSIKAQAALTIFKGEDSDGHGNVDPALSLGLDKFWFKATAVDLPLTAGLNPIEIGPTDSNGTKPVNLDDFLTWEVCEVGQGDTYATASMNGWFQTAPAAGCYKDTGANLNLLAEHTLVFGNFRAVDLKVTKDAAGAFTRTFDWTVTKTSTDAPKITQNGGTATIHYTVTATKDSGTDSNFVISGTIKIANPNPKAVALTGLSDSILNCTLGAATSVDAFSTLSVSYSCPLPDATATSAGANTATVTWSKSGPMALTSGSASNDPTCTDTLLPCAKYDFAAVTPTLVNDSVTVSDPLVGGTLGTPSTTTPYYPTYSQQVPGPGYCTTVTNTATVLDGSAPKHSASVNVDVCGQALTRTLGYWGSHTATTNTQWNTKVLGTTAGLAAFNSWRANSTAASGIYFDEDGQIDTNIAPGTNEVMGCFLSNISKKADGKTARLAIDQSRMQLAQQLCAALINKYALGMNDNGLVATAITNYNGSNASLILASVTALDAFNRSGDSTPFQPVTNIVDVSATSSTSTTQANLKFWDVTLKP